MNLKMTQATSEEIDILRGVAALGVMVGHAIYIQYDVLNGAFWVWIFFVISGFLQGHFFFSNRYTCDVQGIKRYYVNRLLRIVPLLWLILLIGWGIYYYVHHSIDFLQMAREFLCLTSDYKSVGPVWTIACEMSFYLLVPLFAWALQYKQYLVLFGIALALIFLSTHQVYHDNPQQPRMLLGNMYLFLTGMIAALVYSKNYRMPSVIKFAIALVLTVIALNLQRFSPESFWGEWGMRIAAIIAVVVLMFHSRRSFIYDLCGPLRFVGRYCYGVYMYAALIMTAYTDIWHIQPSFLALALQLFSIPLICA